MEKNQINVNAIDGDFLCVQSFDCSEGDLIDICQLPPLKDGGLP